MQKEYIFSQLGPERLDDILALENQIFTTPWSKEQYARLMGAGLCKVFGAAEGAAHGPLAAYAALSINRAAAELEIYNIAVRPSLRRQGLARRLMKLVLEAGRKMGLERAVLEVRAGNAAAINLYTGLGFKRCGCRPAYYAAPVEDALLYEYLFL